MFGINSQEEFVKKFVIPAQFYSQVPDDVKAAYETATYLMAHAWYHWPLYDEALKKLTLLLEMALKIKAKQLNIPSKIVNKKGREISKSLSKLISEICAIEKEKNLHDLLNKVREVRNMFAHPERNSFMGGIASADIIKKISETINQLFLDCNPA